MHRKSLQISPHETSMVCDQSFDAYVRQCVSCSMLIQEYK